MVNKDIVNEPDEELIIKKDVGIETEKKIKNTIFIDSQVDGMDIKDEVPKRRI